MTKLLLVVLQCYFAHQHTYLDLISKSKTVRSEGARTARTALVAIHATKVTQALAIKFDSNSVFLMQLRHCLATE